MPQKTCPVCNRLFSYMAGTLDFDHVCDSGNPTLDQEDTINLEGPGWNLRGAANKASPKARAEGVDVDDVTSRGNNKQTVTQRQRITHVKL